MNSPPQQLDGIFQFPELENSGHETAITIDAAFLKERPFLSNTSWYADLGRKTTSLTLSGIDEKDAASILPVFTTLRHLSLQKMTILNKQFRGLPNKGIESLKLVDCKITTDVALSWFESFDKSLLSVKISRCSHAVQESFVRLLKYLPASVRSLSVYDPICTSISIEILPACLTYLHLETPKGSNHCDTDTIAICAPELTTLILKMSEIDSKSIEELQELKDLQHLRILNSVDCIGQSLLQSMGQLKTLDVHCYAPPAEKNQILTLNDDCLLHVFSFLPNKNWLPLAQAHPRFHRLVSTFIYPREEIFIGRRSFKSFSEQEKRTIIEGLQQHATSVQVTNSIFSDLKLSCFKKLHTLRLCGVLSGDSYQEIPTGIKKLDLHLPPVADEYDEDDDHSFDYWDSPKRYKYDNAIENSESDQADKEQKRYQLAKMFRRLRPSLTSLSLSGDFEPSALSELKSLREFTVKDWKGTDFLGILRTNEHQLERFEVFNGYSFEDCWMESPLPICPLKNLKVLHLIDIICRIDLKHSDFPSLEELKMTFHLEIYEDYKSDAKKSIPSFVQLKSLNMKEVDMGIEEFYPLKNLESLDMYVYSDDIVDLLKELPKLSKLNRHLGRSGNLDFETEIELRQFLIAEKRSLRLNGVVLP